MGRRARTVSARVRILASILAIAAVGLIVVGGVTFVMQAQRINADVDARLHAQIANIRSDRTTPSNPTDGEPATASQTLDPSTFRTVGAFLYAAVSRLAVGRNETALGLVAGRPEYVAPTHDGFDVSGDRELLARIVADTTRADAMQFGTGTSVDGEVRYIALPVTVPGDGTSGIYVRAISLDREFAPVIASAITYAIAALIMLAAIAVGGWFVVGRLLLAPIRQLQDATGAITLGALAGRGERVPTDAADTEVAVLGRTVNEMLDRLEGSVGVQRQLLADVRHELRTPITIVRGHLEIMNVTDADDVRQTRDIGISELDRMSRLVEDIDLLASVEDDEITLGTIDVGALTARVNELVQVIPGHTWDVAAATTGDIRGNYDRLLQAWLALADNAAKYTPDGSPIEVGSTRSPESVHLWVRDHGPGIPAASRHRIFRRFDRGSGRRDVGGSGLGLAIVDAIARAHGGSCTVTDTPGGGATFIIRVPARLGRGTSALPAPVRAGFVVQQREETG